MSVAKKTQAREISLLMHYVDDVFPHQFPFYHSQYVGKREWLLPLLSSIRSVYYATLCLSLLHKEKCFNLDQPESVSFCQEERLRYYILALRETQQLLLKLSPVYNLDTIRYCIPSLASALHLISYEVNSPSPTGYSELYVNLSILVRLSCIWRLESSSASCNITDPHSRRELEQYDQTGQTHFLPLDRPNPF